LEQPLTQAFNYRFEVASQYPEILGSTPRLNEFLYSIQSIIGSGYGDTFHIHALHADFWQALETIASAENPLEINLGVRDGSNASSQVILDSKGATDRSNFYLGAAKDGGIYVAAIDAGQGDGADTQDFEVYHPGTIIIHAGSLGDALALSGDIATPLNGGTLSFIGGTGSDTIDASGLTTLLPIAISMGKGETLAIANVQSLNATVSSLAPGNVIDLLNAGTVSAAYFDTSANKLTIVAGSTTQVLNLDPNEDYTKDSFLIGSDGTGGVAATLMADSDGLAFTDQNQILVVADARNLQQPVTGYQSGDTVVAMNFKPGGTIDIDGAGTPTSAAFNQNTLTVQTSGNGPLTIQLDPGADYSDDSFVFAPDGSGGTEISVITNDTGVTFSGSFLGLLTVNLGRYTGTVNNFVPGNTLDLPNASDASTEGVADSPTLYVNGGSIEISLGTGATDDAEVHPDGGNGIYVLVHMPARKAGVASSAFAGALNDAIPEPLRKTLTYGQGKEMASHAGLAGATGMKIYFAGPHSPWQRGANENTNGLLRQCFPKRTRLPDYGQADLDRVTDALNGRPRKTLDFATPGEHFRRLLAGLAGQQAAAVQRDVRCGT
jgi:hypothetical protein